MDHSFTRGAAAAVLALGTFAAARPAAAQVAAGAVRPARDSVVVRMIGTDQRVLFDSLAIIMRALDSEAPMSEQALKMRREFEAIARALGMARGRAMGGGGGATFLLREGPETMRDLETRHVRGWIGINPGMAPHEQFADSTGFFVRYFKYPEIISVEPNSPAQRAGIIPGDVLVAYDGFDVVNRRIDVGHLLVPDRRLAVTVQRDGESKEFSMTVAKAPSRIVLRRSDDLGDAMGGGGRGFTSAVPSRRPDQAGQPGQQVYVFGPGGSAGDVRFATPFSMDRNGVLGAALMMVSPELAAATKLREGVLIRECPEGTPAFAGGLRAGDAIVSVDGQTVTRTQDVNAIVFSKLREKAVVFQVLRDKKPVAVTVKW